MSIMAGSASLVNQVFSKFLATLPKARSDLVPPKVPVLERTKMALRTLADLVGDSSYATRDPYSSLSFSCVSPEVAQSQLDNLRFYWKDIDKAFCPLGRDGRPMRKSVLFFFIYICRWLMWELPIRYSERKQSHWFHGDHRGMSQVGAWSLPSLDVDGPFTVCSQIPWRYCKHRRTQSRSHQNAPSRGSSPQTGTTVSQKTLHRTAECGERRSIPARSKNRSSKAP